MKVLILAGGFGTRLSEETGLKPKPMVYIGEKPILWHIMKTYSHYGFKEFVILLGYKGYQIKEYFSTYFLQQNDFTIDLATNQTEIHSKIDENWKVTLLDTGVNTMTGGRIKRAQPFVGDNPFMLTYGDGVADINIKDLHAFHQQHGKLLTVTSAQPAGRFGALAITPDNQVTSFMEKPKGDGNWINAGYFVCQPQVFDYIKEGDATVFEQSPLQTLATDQQMYTFKHGKFWKPMDTLNDKSQLTKLWESGKAPWKIWND